MRRLTWFEWVAVAVAGPFLLFPSVRPVLTAAALVLLASVWLARWALRGEPWPLTPFNGALLLFALMIPVGIWASAMPEETLPKATGLILGLAVFRAVGLTVRGRRTVGLATAAFCLLGVAITAAGALSVNWSAKVAALGVVTERVPRLIEGLPSMPAGGVNPNQLAGTLALYVPLAAALAWWARRRGLWETVATVAFLALVGGVLVLTQSRSGWMGGAAGLMALAAMAALTSRSRWTRAVGIGLPTVALAGVVGTVAVVGPQAAGEALYGRAGAEGVESVVGSISLAGRVEIWSRALYAIQDFAFTGCGLGTFREVVHILYPLFLISPGTDIAHAHNMFLQTAVDLGLPGLVAYVALLLVGLAGCWKVAAEGGGLRRAAALGLAAGMVGFHVYGLADAVALGAKPGVAFWFALALIASLEEKDTDGPGGLG
ncbi:MAG: O-antigen ligase family protein [Chloroflexota bacterium]|nr:O-antigen ligase family protein [Chloroflexota bacterium]